MNKPLRDVLCFGLLLLACSLAAHSQSFGPYTITGTGCTPAVDVSHKATAAYQIKGSWSGTIQPKVSVAGQPLVNAQATPANSTTPAATVTANGAYFSSVSGPTAFTLCGATVTSSATIYINLSTAPH